MKSLANVLFVIVTANVFVEWPCFSMDNVSRQLFLGHSIQAQSLFSEKSEICSRIVPTLNDCEQEKFGKWSLVDRRLGLGQEIWYSAEQALLWSPLLVDVIPGNLQHFVFRERAAQQCKTNFGKNWRAPSLTELQQAELSSWPAMTLIEFDNSQVSFAYQGAPYENKHSKSNHRYVISCVFEVDDSDHNRLLEKNTQPKRKWRLGRVFAKKPIEERVFQNAKMNSDSTQNKEGFDELYYRQFVSLQGMPSTKDAERVQFWYVRQDLTEKIEFLLRLGVSVKTNRLVRGRGSKYSVATKQYFDVRQDLVEFGSLETLRSFLSAGMDPLEIYRNGPRIVSFEGSVKVALSSVFFASIYYERADLVEWMLQNHDIQKDLIGDPHKYGLEKISIKELILEKELKLRDLRKVENSSEFSAISSEVERLNALMTALKAVF